MVMTMTIMTFSHDGYEDDFESCNDGVNDRQEPIAIKLWFKSEFDFL